LDDDATSAAEFTPSPAGLLSNHAGALYLKIEKSRDAPQNFHDAAVVLRVLCTQRDTSGWSRVQ
jgi:hypothetical protein